MVILSAVVIRSMLTNKVIETTGDGAISYTYETEREKLSDALYQALLESFVREEIKFEYAKIPENLVKILEENGQFECTLVNPDDNGYAIYDIAPVGKGFKFTLKLSNVNGAYELIGPEE